MKKLYGITVAMVTPLKKEGGLNQEALVQLTHRLIAHGVDCLYPCGTTGEMLKLSLEERKRIAQTVVDAAAGRVPVFIHAGAAAPEDTLELARHAREIGADGVGIVSPQFFSCTPREMFAYYDGIAEALPEDFPIYLYCIPQCAATDISPQVAKALWEKHRNIIGIKYSFLDMVRTAEYIEVDPAFSVLHGCDQMLGSLLILGCDGTVSGVSGVVPEPFVRAYKAYGDKDYAQVQYWQKACREICNILRHGANMAYFKSGLEVRGIPGGSVRQPQMDLSPEEQEQLKTQMLAFLAKYNIPAAL